MFIVATADPSVDYTLGTAELVGTDADDFEITLDTCSTVVLNAGSPSCPIAVRFAPTEVGGADRTAMLRIGDDASSTLLVVELNGEITDLPFVDEVAPTTTLASLKVNRRKATAKFSGNDDQPGAVTYQCSLDGKPFGGCKSPKVYKRLNYGKHTFKVRARDVAGNADASPTVKRFTVKRPRRN